MELAERLLNGDCDIPDNEDGSPFTLGDIIESIETYVFIDNDEEEEEDA